MPTELTLPTQDELERLSEQGQAIYDERLKAVLEPEFNGQEVAIHLDSGDYEVAKNATYARRALRARQPTGLILTTNIGPGKLDSLALRMLASQILTGNAK